MLIRTEHLILRPFEYSDLDLVFLLYSDEEILRYTPFDTMNRIQAEQHLSTVIRDWEADPQLSYEMAVVLKETGDKIGRAHILIDPETDTGMIGGLLIPEHWGKHFAREIAGALIRYCFDTLGLHRVNATCSPENTASWKMLESCGMRREAHYRQKCRYIKNGTESWHDELEYAMLASERA